MEEKICKFSQFSLIIGMLFLAFTAKAGAKLIANYDDLQNEVKTFQVNTALHLHCNNSLSGPENKLIWERNGFSVEDAENNKMLKGRYVIRDAESSFMIERAWEEDEGNYTCRIKSNLNEFANIRVVANISNGIAANINTVEEEQLQIKCLIVGYPNITWLYENDTVIQPTDRIEFKPDEKERQDAILFFKSTLSSDRGIYKCNVSNWLTTLYNMDPKQARTYVRVKGKLAALWPFLGICCEVLILSIIILYYEKKHRSAEPDDSDTDQGPDTDSLNEVTNEIEEPEWTIKIIPLKDEHYRKWHL